MKSFTFEHTAYYDRSESIERKWTRDLRRCLWLFTVAWSSARSKPISKPVYQETEKEKKNNEISSIVFDNIYTTTPTHFFCSQYRKKKNMDLYVLCLIYWLCIYIEAYVVVRRHERRTDYSLTSPYSQTQKKDVWNVWKTSFCTKSQCSYGVTVFWGTLLWLGFIPHVSRSTGWIRIQFAKFLCKCMRFSLAEFKLAGSGCTTVQNVCTWNTWLKSIDAQCLQFSTVLKGLQQPQHLAKNVKTCIHTYIYH